MTGHYLKSIINKRTGRLSIGVIASLITIMTLIFSIFFVNTTEASIPLNNTSTLTEGKNLEETGYENIEIPQPNLFEEILEDSLKSNNYTEDNENKEILTLAANLTSDAASQNEDNPVSDIIELVQANIELAQASTSKTTSSSASGSEASQIENPDLEFKFEPPFVKEISGFKFTITKVSALVFGQFEGSLQGSIHIPVVEKDLLVKDIRIDKKGLKAAQIDIVPTAPDKNLFSQSYNWGSLTLEKGILKIADNKFDSVTFSGDITVLEKKFVVPAISITTQGISGNIILTNSMNINIGLISLDLDKSILFNLSKGKFYLKVEKAAIGLGSFFPGNTSKIEFVNLEIEDGNISFETTLNKSFTLLGLTVSINKLKLKTEVVASTTQSTPGGQSTGTQTNTQKAGGTSQSANSTAKSATGTKVLNVWITGGLSFPEPKINITFNSLYLSTSGVIEADVSVPQLQELKLFNASLTISKTSIKITKEVFAIKLNGSFAFTKGLKGIEFVDFQVDSKGNISGKLNIDEKNPLSFPYCEFIKVTKLEIKDNTLYTAGRIDLPAP